MIKCAGRFFFLGPNSNKNNLNLKMHSKEARTKKCRKSEKGKIGELITFWRV